MDFVYLLWYVREIKGNDEEFFLGVYTSEEEAKAAITRLKDKKGFVDDINGFQIHRYELNRDNWTEGFVFVDD
jgi:hypothetical protein